MIGKVIGAIAGKRLSQDVSGVGGTRGALLGVGAATVLRRLGPLGMVAVAVGGYALKKRHDQHGATRSR
ncbi:hypothetical protein [Novosphingobium sp.]|jgi:hypothetical protein|uniref:hypothetical protein n=1 Tax=Novosphingobium sp. TaxID=1874826 RepID=UPI0028A9FE70|nr:hypothetical protein [Novosphingobium sp.]